METRYQVFISSTFADLIEERGKVQQAVMELECIPAGMELFPAIDEDQFEFIKKVIDDCDYYLLIIGARYGSISDEGVSYTEMEYRYAVSKGIKVIALLHKDPDSLPVNRAETDAEARKKLAAFRNEVEKGRLVKFWTESNELPSLTTSSLSRTMRTYPAVGWVRGNKIAQPELYKELAEVRKENQELRQSLAESLATVPTVISGLASIDNRVIIRGFGTYNEYIQGMPIKTTVHWKATVTWKTIFGYLGAELLSSQSDEILNLSTASWLKNKSDKSDTKLLHNKIIKEDYQTIKIQFKALGLIKSIESGGGLIWSLTEQGERVLIDLRVIRSENDSESLNSL